MTFSLLFGLAKLQSDYSSSALAGGSLSPLESVDPSLFSCIVPAYGWTTPVPARHGRTSQMFAFYSNVSALLKCIGAQLKITENGQSITLQPGFT